VGFLGCLGQGAGGKVLVRGAGGTVLMLGPGAGWAVLGAWLRAVSGCVLCVVGWWVGNAERYSVRDALKLNWRHK